MNKKKSVFLYPITKAVLREGNNDYIKQLMKHLGSDFAISNRVSGVGLLDALLKFRKTDVYYFNWVEDVPTKRFGTVQVFLLFVLLQLCKISNKKVVWFVHNNISHYKERLALKKRVIKLMTRYADLVLSHSTEVKLKLPANKLQIFHHPIEDYQPLAFTQPFRFDLLIWGKVSAYKGVAEFVQFVASSPVLRNYRILLAGKFASDAYYDEIMKNKPDNLVVRNEFITHDSLLELFLQSRYVLFTYTSTSVLSSAALCKTLSFGKEVIGPNIGSFKELGERKLIYTYDSFQGLGTLLKDLAENKRPQVEAADLRQYVQQTSWKSFSAFVIERINGLFAKGEAGIHQTFKYKSVESEPI